MTLSEELTWRGFVNQTTFKDITELDKKQWTFYHGFDASADSQTVGNLAGMMFDMTLIRHGFKAIVLAGGATSLIGDPGGKDSERPLQDEKTIAHNVACAEKQLRRIYAGHDFTLVDNLDWTRNMTVIEFLRDVGKHFGMTSLIQRDYISRRLGEGGAGISYTEFSYSLLQGMDFLHLYDTYGATLEVGSSDQWSNCIAGIELIRKARGAEAHVLTHPLVINKATGKKFGKSEAGAIWLDSNKTSVFDFYQFWLKADDEGVSDYLKVYTVLDKPTVDDIMDRFRQNPKERLAQKTLAFEVTKIVHGEDQAHAAEAATKSLFAGGPSELTPTVDIEAGTYSIVDLVVKAGLATSNSDARRLFDQGGIRLNQQKVEQDEVTIASGDLLQAGKRKFVKIA
jgi:tyrosyl-tRNA synthetase